MIFSIKDKSKYSTSLLKLRQEIVGCRLCPRLVKWRERVAREKRPSFCEESYWGKPVSGFGDPGARLFIVGLAPAAHGANRTGRVFTGDRSGEWLYRALFQAGFSNQPQSVHNKDGLKLTNAYVSSIVRCAPPGNKPTPDERDRCLPFFMAELDLLKDCRVILALGTFAFENILRVSAQMGFLIKPKPKFSHGVEVTVGPYVILGSFHPSQQNTFTGKLTKSMFDQIFDRAKKLALE